MLEDTVDWDRLARYMRENRTGNLSLHDVMRLARQQASVDNRKANTIGRHVYPECSDRMEATRKMIDDMNAEFCHGIGIRFTNSRTHRG